MPEPALTKGQPHSFRAALDALAAAQKSPKGGQAYSVYVNRRLGRIAAAVAYRFGLTPNIVTAISGFCSLAGLVIIALVSSGWVTVAAPLLAVGYALDAADGQLARLRGGGSLAGEWIDHMVDSVKITLVHLVTAIHLYRFSTLDDAWLLVPLGFTVVSVALFFAQLLNDQLRRQVGVNRHGSAETRANPLMLFAKLPHDYGLLCWWFVTLPWPELFISLYGFLFACNAVYFAAACRKWLREVQDLDRLRA